MTQSVKLISYSKLSDTARSDLGINDTLPNIIGYMARVSNPDNQSNPNVEKLIAYLKDNSHWSPFEMVNICIEVNTTRDIARQILRHRSFSFQEYSQRYADPTKDLEFVTREPRLQDTKNRQNSIETDNVELQSVWDAKQKFVIEQAKIAYEWAVSNGIAKEQARAVLPEGNTMSKLYMNGTLRSFLHYIEVRTHESTQKEHREIALMIEMIIMNLLKGE
jgi:thymidylate synthase (FAD)